MAQIIRNAGNHSLVVSRGHIRGGRVYWTIHGNKYRCKSFTALGPTVANSEFAYWPGGKLVSDYLVSTVDIEGGADPCDRFSTFSCANFQENHPDISSYFDVGQKNVDDVLRNTMNDLSVSDTIRDAR